MTDFYFFEQEDKPTRLLEKYLKALSENPDSGVKCVNIASDKLQEFEDQRIKDGQKLYELQRLNNPYNPRDVMGDPAAAKELFRHLRKQARNRRK